MRKIFLACLVVAGCTVRKQSQPDRPPTVIDQVIKTDGNVGSFQKGIPVYDGKTVLYCINGKEQFSINFKQPVVVDVASKPEKWGYFQFPNIGFKADGNIQVRWNMTRDAIEAYGEDTYGSASSSDMGKTWKLQDSSQLTGIIKLNNGDRLDIVNPKPIKVSELKLPKPVGEGLENYRKSNFTFYRLYDLPESRQGVYLKRLKKGDKEWKLEKASLFDPDAARYSLSGLFPIVWWGDIHTAADGSLIAGVYPGFLIDKNGVADQRSGVFFYRSVDNGHSWKIQGRIPYNDHTVGDAMMDKRMGYTEPGFEILQDGTFICILRTTDGAGLGPMFTSYSKDMGKTWTKPEVIAGNGVLPRVLQLDNGITVLASGRPGVQLRFMTDQKGLSWTDPFEMLPYETNKTGNELVGHMAEVSDGYTGLLPLGKDKFMLVYSDFNYKNLNGEIRKAIKVREVEVIRK